MNEYIAYYRVSTAQQGRSGLGLAAQRHAVLQFTNTTPPLAEFTEVETGKNDQRPKLQAAIALAQRTGSTLLVAKLDRLSRNAAFIFALKEAQVKFVCCDMPDANTLTVGIMAVLAQDERERISQRTKAALDEKRRRIGEWRISNLTDVHRAQGRAIHQANAQNNSNNRKALFALRQFLNSSLKPTQSLRHIASELNNAGFKTARNKNFRATTVYRLIRKIQAEQK